MRRLFNRSWLPLQNRCGRSGHHPGTRRLQRCPVVAYIFICFQLVQFGRDPMTHTPQSTVLWWRWEEAAENQLSRSHFLLICRPMTRRAETPEPGKNHQLRNVGWASAVKEMLRLFHILCQIYSDRQQVHWQAESPTSFVHLPSADVIPHLEGEIKSVATLTCRHTWKQYCTTFLGIYLSRPRQ